MTLEKIQNDMILALKAGDKERKNTLSSLVDSIKKSAIDKKCRDNITEDLVNTVILKEQKTVKEMIDTCPESRKDLLDEYNLKYKIVSEYTPKMMEKEEIENYLIDIFNSIEPIKSNKGKIMKLCSNLKGKADMKIVSEIVNSKLM